MTEPVRLGPFELVGRLGAGGMGEVHEARDTRLDRSVALKVLPVDALGSPEARARFLREARLAAALNHPNIVTIFEADVAHSPAGDRYYIAMERVTGQTLAARLAKGVPGLEEALDWALQIAEGLAHAHAAGVVHRDLKPANVMITADGRAKVLDFGLAKHVGSGTDRGLLRSATVSDATAAGVVLGTVAYMSPEQAEGRDVDARSDIFSFGALLYELLTGRRPFGGSSMASVFGALLRDTPTEPSRLRRELGPDLDRVVQKALEKTPANRYQHADELLVDLRAARRKLLGSGAHAGPSASATAPSRRRLAALAAVAGLVGVVAGGAWAWHRIIRPAPEVMRFIMPLPGDLTFDNAGGFGSAIAVAPDGSQIVVAVFDEEKDTTRLLRQRVGEFTVSAIEGTDGGRAPFISYDGKWVGFMDKMDVKRVPMSGSASVDEANLKPSVSDTLLSVDTALYGGDFDRDGDTIVIGECTRGLRAWSLSRKVKDRISDIAPDALGVYQHQFPQALPDDKHLLLTAWRGPGAELHLRNRETGEERKLLDNATYGRYVASGHLVYAWEGKLHAVPFDMGRLEVTGPPVEVLDGVLTESWRGAAHFSVSETGTLAYLPGGLHINSPRLGLAGGDGQVRPIEDLYRGQGLAFSPDGTELLTSVPNGARGEVWAYEIERRLWRPIFRPGEDVLEGFWWPLWSRDGRSIWYEEAAVGGAGTLKRVALDDGGAPVSVLTGNAYVQPQGWTPDGVTLVYTRGADDVQGYDIWAYDTKTGRDAALVATPAGEIHPAVSPDGRWLAYTSTASGRLRVVVQPFGTSGPVVQVTGDGHVEPRWSPDGRRLFYRSEDGRTIFAVPFEAGPTPRIGAPVVAWQGGFVRFSQYGSNWALAPDGTVAAVWLRGEPLAKANQYVVVLNWFDELKRLVPTD